MGQDDDDTCREHVWVFTGVTVDDAGQHREHECARCEAVLVEPVRRSGPEPV